MTRRVRPTGGGGARHPASLANLRNAPAAPPANARARTHGGFARVGRERLAEKVRELCEAMGEDLPLRAADGGVPAADEARLSLAARAMARLEDVERYHDEYGWRDTKTGDPRPSVDLERRLRGEVAAHLDALGCSPASRVRLGVDLQRGFDLAAHWTEQDAAERAALADIDSTVEDRDG